MQVTIPFDVKVQGRASSGTTVEAVQRRLSVLAGRTSPAVEQERRYLLDLLQRLQEST